MRAIFLGKHKRSAARALAHLLENGVEVPALVAPPPGDDLRGDQRLDRVAAAHGVPLTSVEELYRDPPPADLVISFLFWKRIHEPLISHGRLGCLNFHPAPLPDFRGVGGYNVAILEGLSEWGVSCHFVDEELDTGDVVEVERFAIDPATETALSLDLRSQERLLALFTRVLDRLTAGRELPRTPQASLGEGRYVSRDEFDALRRVKPGDDLGRKLRAFWYPPWPGAVIEVDGRELTLVDQAVLDELAAVYRAAGRVP